MTGRPYPRAVLTCTYRRRPGTSGRVLTDNRKEYFGHVIDYDTQQLLR